MQGEFERRGLGVRPQGGRPPAEAPPELVEILRKTYEEGTQYRLDITGFNVNEVEQVARRIRSGAAVLDLQPRIYGVRSGKILRFWAEAKSSE